MAEDRILGELRLQLQAVCIQEWWEQQEQLRPATKRKGFNTLFMLAGFEYGLFLLLLMCLKFSKQLLHFFLDEESIYK